MGTALAATVEMNDDSVWTEADAMRLVGKPVLSGIPMIASPKEQLVRLWQAVGMVAATVVVSGGTRPRPLRSRREIPLRHSRRPSMGRRTGGEQ